MESSQLLCLNMTSNFGILTRYDGGFYLLKASTKCLQIHHIVRHPKVTSSFPIYVPVSKGPLRAMLCVLTNVLETSYQRHPDVGTTFPKYVTERRRGPHKGVKYGKKR